jgi:2-polyprenyl-6-methoxyphenol hydroxylase-like FAD-dependent oxidoreductase
VTEQTEVLVVGAGPTGLTLAAGLLKRGVRTRVVDREASADPHSKAIIVWPRALEALDAVGVGEAAFERGVKVVASSYYTAGRLVGRLEMPPLGGTRFPVAVSLPQSTTEGLLREAVRREGGEVEFGLELVSLEQDGDAAVAGFADGSRIRASYVVGCDGAHSAVREQCGVAFDGAPYEQTFVLVDGEYDTEYAHDESYYIMHPAGVIVVVGLPGGLHRVFASVPPGVPVEDAEQTVREIVAKHSPLPMVERRAVGSGVFRIHRRLAANMRIGRVLLAGDAAHIHSPAGGLGMNTGIEDAHSLAWRLAGLLRGAEGAQGLDEWEAERLFVAKHVIAETDQQTRMWMMTGWQRTVRDLAIEFGLGSGVIEQVLPRRLAQFDLALPASGPGLGRLRPGVRVADVPLGRDLHVHDLIRPGGHALLVIGADPVPALAALGIHARPDAPALRIALITADPACKDEVGDVVHDASGRVKAELCAPEEAVCLIRPDGVIAAVVSPADTEALAALRERIDRIVGARSNRAPDLAEGAAR